MNGRLGLTGSDGRWELSVFGRNLTEDDFFTNKYRFDFGETGIWGSSVRTYGVTLRLMY
mgnify:CR=1 FL=1